MAGERIMIVEDEHIVALDIRKTIETLGYAVDGVHATGEACLESLNQHRPDLVLMDVRLAGEIDGFETARICREKHDIPVVMLTAFADESTLERGKTSQPLAYVVKPFDPRELNTAIFMSIYRHRMEKTVRDQRERLRRSEKMEALGRLTGGIAHDFNNLLTVILGYSRLIRDELPDIAKPTRDAIADEVAGIEKAAQKSSALTRQLLSFSRNQTSDQEAICLSDVINRMEPILSKLVHDDVALTIDVSYERDSVYADRSQLEQVLINLVANARDAMTEGGRLIIRTARRRVGSPDVVGRKGVEPGLFVELTVSDTGSGMSPDTVSRAFDPFFTTKEEGRGTGLGLSTVYGIVTRCHGFIDVESVPGEGTAFTVCLPLLESTESGGEVHEAVASGDGGDETILLVEDDETIRELIAQVLRRRGYAVLQAANAGEALLHAENHAGSIELLISDVVMPLMSGVRLAERLRESRPETMVLLLSGYPESALTAEECDTLNVDFLSKPIDPPVLLMRVRRILDA